MQKLTAKNLLLGMKARRVGDKLFRTVSSVKTGTVCCVTFTDGYTRESGASSKWEVFVSVMSK